MIKDVKREEEQMRDTLLLRDGVRVSVGFYFPRACLPRTPLLHNAIHAISDALETIKITDKDVEKKGKKKKKTTPPGYPSLYLHSSFLPYTGSVST